MAAKRKGGLKLNAICAKLSRQVVYDGSSQHAEGDLSLPDNSEKGSSHYEEADRPEPDFPEGLNLGPSFEEDQRRREAIEKWVNGEYSDEPSLDCGEPREPRPNPRDDGPPEGVYMVQPKGCSEEEDNADEPGTLPGSRASSYRDDRDSEDAPHKEDSYTPSSEPPCRPTPFSPPGNFPSSPALHALALRGYGGVTGFSLPLIYIQFGDLKAYFYLRYCLTFYFTSTFGKKTQVSGEVAIVDVFCCFVTLPYPHGLK